MKTPLAPPIALLVFLVLGLQAPAAAAQCLSSAGPLADAAADTGQGLWMAALGLMAGIAWRRQGR